MKAEFPYWLRVNNVEELVKILTLFNKISRDVLL